MAKKEPKVVQEPAKDVEIKDEIKIPSISTQRMTVRVRGISPLITHAWSEKARKEMRDKQTKEAKGGKAARPAKVPTDEFNGARYVIEGADCVPASAFKKAIMAAAKFTDVASTTTGMSLFVHGDKGNGQYVSIEGGEPSMREDMVRVGPWSNRTADLRYRPEYANWACEFEIEYNANAISPQQILNLVNIAGFSVGLCEWRPQKGGGDFGRFELDQMVEPAAAAE